MLKICTKCSKEKPLSEFYKTGKGYVGNICKPCKLAYLSNWQDKNKDRVTEAQRRHRAKRAEYYRELGREKYAANPDEYLKRTEKWRVNNRDKVATAQQTRREVHPEKYNAYMDVQRAINIGELVRPDTCSNCACKCKPDGHHEDYSKPLDVVWLCRPCHMEVHREL